jgi:hypothetical protein
MSSGKYDHLKSIVKQQEEKKPIEVEDFSERMKQQVHTNEKYVQTRKQYTNILDICYDITTYVGDFIAKNGIILPANTMMELESEITQCLTSNLCDQIKTGRLEVSNDAKASNSIAMKFCKDYIDVITEKLVGVKYTAMNGKHIEDIVKCIQFAAMLTKEDPPIQYFGRVGQRYDPKLYEISNAVISVKQIEHPGLIVKDLVIERARVAVKFDDGNTPAPIGVETKDDVVKLFPENDVQFFDMVRKADQWESCVWDISDAFANEIKQNVKIQNWEYTLDEIVINALTIRLYQDLVGSNIPIIPKNMNRLAQYIYDKLVKHISDSLKYPDIKDNRDIHALIIVCIGYAQLLEDLSKKFKYEWINPITHNRRVPYDTTKHVCDRQAVEIDRVVFPGIELTGHYALKKAKVVVKLLE